MSAEQEFVDAFNNKTHRFFEPCEGSFETQNVEMTWSEEDRPRRAATMEFVFPGGERRKFAVVFSPEASVESYVEQIRQIATLTFTHQVKRAA